MLVCILDYFLCITIGFFGISGYLFAQTFDLLIFAAGQLSNFFLHFTGDVFYSSFDLILVHDQTPSSKLTGLPIEEFRLNLMLPPVCAVTNNNIGLFNKRGVHGNENIAIQCTDSSSRARQFYVSC